MLCKRDAPLLQPHPVISGQEISGGRPRSLFSAPRTEAIRAEGTAWFGATDWNGRRAMRISVCNYRTTDHDVDLTLAAVERVLGGTP